MKKTYKKEKVYQLYVNGKKINTLVQRITTSREFQQLVIENTKTKMNFGFFIYDVDWISLKNSKLLYEIIVVDWESRVKEIIKNINSKSIVDIKNNNIKYIYIFENKFTLVHDLKIGDTVKHYLKRKYKNEYFKLSFE